MPTQYYVAGPENRRLGPFTAAQIAKGVAEGEIPDSAYAAPVGGQEWTKIYALPELAAALKTTTMPFHRANLNGLETDDPGIPIGTATVVGVSPAVNAAIASATAAATKTATPTSGTPTAGPPSVEVNFAPQPPPPQPPPPQHQPPQPQPAGPPMITPPGIVIDQFAHPPQTPPSRPSAPPPSMPARAPAGGNPLSALLDRVPRNRLPLVIFGAFAAFGLLETLIVVIARAI